MGITITATAARTNVIDSLKRKNTMKRLKQRTEGGYDGMSAAGRIQEHTVLKVARCIGDAATLFAFLEAFRPLHVLGPLEHLYQLGLVWDHSRLWPSLTVRGPVSDDERTHLEAILKLYTRVTVDCSSFDLDWLERHLHPLAEMSWTKFPHAIPGASSSTVREWYLQWACLRITSVTASFRYYQHDSHCDLPVEFVAVLSQLPHLTSLHVSSCSDDVAAGIFAFAGQCSSLTELTFDTTSDVVVTDAVCRDLLSWFSSTRVRHFQVSNWNTVADNVDPVLLDRVHSAMFKALDSLGFRHSNLIAINPTAFTFPMQALTLSQCVLSPAFVNTLVARLPASNVESLTFHLRLLPDVKTLRTLELGGGRHRNALTVQKEWTPLIPLLVPTRVKTLTLRDIGLSKICLRQVVHAVCDNVTIDEINVYDEKISFADVKLLMENTTHNDRPVKLKSIDIGRSTIKPSGLAMLTAAAARCNVHFHYSSK
ncbi:hypothetical protein DYB37_013725 [Aphanomyces astaci]|uniref:F-box domain-containing protein n=2 Tax=Aphanomyces astaci TaxID=112090 RepID=A0A397CAR1_APHAT|nr:hypothetical protein DYB34_008127 [Aphanomyces astaci]RHY40241.1 hypothetical protein DYB30_007285 [Aphanomyces astaci]RHY90629.1 hypothetical protein DYB35_013073 [Aphanomyces astaci]RHZ05668.1 hypothetical protein DYB37_013725 [Aphanomyces astaci]RHZ27896.1 hypothetical protein DYB26_009502 [Aphanomyces astaci]